MHDITRACSPTRICYGDEGTILTCACSRLQCRGEKIKLMPGIIADFIPQPYKYEQVRVKDSCARFFVNPYLQHDKNEIASVILLNCHK